MGTRFLLTRESPMHPSVKERYLKAPSVTRPSCVGPSAIRSGCSGTASPIKFSSWKRPAARRTRKYLIWPGAGAGSEPLKPAIPRPVPSPQGLPSD